MTPTDISRFRSGFKQFSRGCYAVLFLLIIFVLPTSTQASEKLTTLLSTTDGAGVLLLDPAGQVVFSFNTSQPLVPASTVKLLTTLMALEHWGAQYRFSTVFDYDANSETLRVFGSGDPFLVSEELFELARQLKARLGKAQVSSLELDSSLFTDIDSVPGQTLSTNPYDALPAALSANFNTLNLAFEDGALISAEPQTPLTEFALVRGKELNVAGRVNTGFTKDAAALYFGELLVAFMRDAGVRVADVDISLSGPSSGLTSGFTSENTFTPLLSYENSRELADVLRLMLKYSTNFIANQLALSLAAEKLDEPAGFLQLQGVMATFIEDRFAWRDTVFFEGAGLSPDNRVSAEQLVDLVSSLAYWRESVPGLLPEYREGVFAKTGTLSGVSSLAGVLVGDSGAEFPFAIMLNDAEIKNASARDEVLDKLLGLVD